ncbi:GIY-YIG nuclease family protein [uncultured Pseudacidovorax sp.]|uniref:GIY-YIG nuclease family protein n=1 Tax=uncultured Pseudacidovorax sp. TaxID=679313 RepID=UPI0025E32B94|nr:GIY-YIG nuclease family protein [uncultured Pseudacidovorax sp.]
MTPSLSLQARRELTRQYKQAFPAMGIYALRCDAAALLRVGSSRHLDGIFNRLRFELMRGAHRDRTLQSAWDTHGAEAFRFEVVDRVKERDDPAFDYDAELATLLALWEAELLSPAAERGARQGGDA